MRLVTQSEAAGASYELEREYGKKSLGEHNTNALIISTHAILVFTF